MARKDEQLHGNIDAASLKDLNKALAEVSSAARVRVRRALLKESANVMVRGAKRAVSQFDLSPSGKATLRRAIYRRDPKSRTFMAGGRKRTVKPVRATVSVRRGSGERAGAQLRYTSGAKKGEVKGTRSLNRDAYWWWWFERGTKHRKNRGKIEGQNIFKEAFDAFAPQAIKAGERAGFKALEKELKKIEAKAATKGKDI